MTTQELLNRIDVCKTSSYGHYKVTIQYKGKEYTCITTNSEAYDRYNDEERKGNRYYSQLDALKDLWNECKRKNSLK